ncbi:hypothetical protein PIB30_027925 [Stylosanthes scabra]|uniref:Uncharacterized protein n=1 Tax=Stylosanthes scabra TaxID=79078 RepID=A0ABU6QAF8_9FABA|nr:hypothetical protein [Stylosanthes scabra]
MGFTAGLPGRDGLTHRNMDKRKGMIYLLQSGLLGDHGRRKTSIGALAFDLDYARWVEEHQSLIGDLRSALNSQMGDNELNLLVDGVLAHHDELHLLVDGVLHVYVATYSSIH